MSDDAIQFGDLQEESPESRRRPDQNKHFAVIACGQPRENDLPIYVDLDCMLDMEEHALEDTNVELGGVLLGGTFEDDEGASFILIDDSLRAQHYEATKGSFKFTHETWSQITRERDEFPDDYKMVGWYHTHPGWGVFLSGMDMFICQNFFNKKLDTALVIDPCNDERGFFQWDGVEKRQLGGFFLIASRHRREELETYAALLEGAPNMAQRTSLRQAAGGGPAPVVNVVTPNNHYFAAAVVAMLTIQFFLMALVAWKIVGPSPSEEATTEIARLRDQRSELIELNRAWSRLEIREQTLDEIVGKVAGAPDELIQDLADERTRSDELGAALAGQNAINKMLQLQKQRLETELAAEEKARAEEVKELKDEKSRLASRAENYLAKIDTLNARIEELGGEPIEVGDKEEADDEMLTMWVLAGVIAVVILGSLVLVAMKMRSDEEADFAADHEPPREEGDV